MKATDRFPRSARLLAVLAGLLVGGAACLAQNAVKVTVADVIPEGNYHVPSQRIMSLIKTRPGDEYNQATIDDDLRRLYETHLFAPTSKVWVEDAGGGKVRVHFQLVELSNKVEEIVYEGAQHFKPDDLDQATGLHKGMLLNPVANQVACQAILRKYHEKGRLFATVELVEGDKMGDKRVVFRITEGRVIKVSGVEFTGVNFVPSGRLRTQVQTSGAFFQLIGGEYNEQMVQADIGKLIEYYRLFGFHDVQVGRELQWNEDHTMVKVIFHVHEGTRYRLASIDVEGAKSLPPVQLLSYTAAQPGEYFNGAQIKVGAINIQDA